MVHRAVEDVQVGEGVAGWKRGDRVAVRPLEYCGTCPACRAGHEHVCHTLKVIGVDLPGAMQGSLSVPARTLHALPENLSLEEGALVEPLAVACHDVRLGEVAPGEHVVVLGAGPIGVLIGLVARLAGARVVLSEVNPFRRGLAARLGIEAVDPRAVDLPELVDKQTGGASCVTFGVNGCDGVAQLSELKGLTGYTGFDPKDPTRLSSVNKVDPNVKAPITHELLVGVDRELMPNFGVSATFTYRRMADLLWDPLTGVTASSYAQSGTLTGTLPEVGAFSVPLYALKASAVPAGGGQTETNRPGYHQRYWGVELSATKRLSNHWQARFGFSTNDWREYFDDPSVSIVDPTKGPASQPPGRPFAGPQVDGGMVAQQSIGSGKSNIFLVAPTYQFVANGSYEGPWGINVGASLVTRQGYAEPFFQSNVSTGDPLGLKQVLIVPRVDAFRLDPVTSFDGRIEKRFTFGSSLFALDFDVFNLFNAGTILGKQYDARLTGATGFDQVLEIMNPRIARLGLRFTF